MNVNDHNELQFISEQPPVLREDSSKRPSTKDAISFCRAHADVWYRLYEYDKKPNNGWQAAYNNAYQRVLRMKKYASERNIDLCVRWELQGNCYVIWGMVRSTQS